MDSASSMAQSTVCTPPAQPTSSSGTYRIHCLMPNDRSLSLIPPGLLDVAEDTADDDAIASVRIPVHLKESRGAIDTMTREEMGVRMGFTYIPRLMFLHEYLLRDVIACPVGQSASELCLDQERLTSLLLQPFMDMVSIRYVNDAIGYGLFAEQRILADDMLGEYVGMVHDNPDTLKTYSLLFPSSGGSHQVDSLEYGNETRFINHSSNPNCEYIHVLVDNLCHVICRAKRDIRSGEQITVDYGQSYWSKLKTQGEMVLPVEVDAEGEEERGRSLLEEDGVSCHTLCSLIPLFFLTCAFAACDMCT